MVSSVHFRRDSLLAAFLFSMLLGLVPLANGANEAAKLRPGLKPPGFEQMQTAAFLVQTDVSPAYLNKLARQIFNAEKRMYKLFKLSYGFLKGNDPKAKLDKRFGIPGDSLSRMGFKPWIELRIFKKFDDYADEYFDESNRLVALVNKKPIRKETPEQRAVRRVTEGVPGAYYMRIRDYDLKFTERRIRGYLGAKDPDEVESEMLHELGHLFLETYLMEFAGAPKAGQEAQKRGTPAWIGEGVAQLFEVNWAKSRTAQLKQARYNAMIYEAVKGGDSYPFGKFINITNAHNLAAVANDPLASTINYAQSYSVMQYMVEKDWQRFLTFLENCRAYNMQKSRKQRGRISELYSIQNKAFKDAFTIPVVEVEKYWRKHVISSMEKRLKAHPEDYYWCGEYFLRKKDLAKAENRFKLAIEGAPTKGGGYLGMGRVSLMSGKLKEAVKYLLKAAELNPKDEYIWYYLGMAQVRTGQAKAALASLENAVKIFPLFHQAQSELGLAYYEARQYKKALAGFDMAFQISKHPQYLISMGHAAFYDRDYNTAMKNFAAFCNIYQKDPKGAFWYGMAAWRLGQKEYALKKLQEAAQWAPSNKLYRQGLAMAQQGKTIRFNRESAAPDEVVAPPANGKQPKKPKKVVEEEE